MSSTVMSPHGHCKTVWVGNNLWRSSSSKPPAIKSTYQLFQHFFFFAYINSSPQKLPKQLPNRYMWLSNSFIMVLLQYSNHKKEELEKTEIATLWAVLKYHVWYWWFLVARYWTLKNCWDNLHSYIPSFAGQILLDSTSTLCSSTTETH